MIQHLDFETFTSLADSGKAVAVFRQIPADMLSPIAAYQALHQEGSESYLLESIDGAQGVGRYSYIGMDPSIRLQARGREISISNADENEDCQQGDPFDAIRRLLQSRSVASHEALPPFIGGAIGYAGYDTVRLFETLPDRHSAEHTLPDIAFGFHDTVIAFDHYKRIATIIRIVSPGSDLRRSYGDAMNDIDALQQRIISFRPASSVPTTDKTESYASIETDLDDKEYQARVRKAQDYIRAGDIFQVVLSRTFRRASDAQPFDIYRALRMINPSPYMFFLQQSDTAILGSSPEKLCSLEDGVIESMPIAGTRNLQHSSDHAALAADLLADPKERAEHMMLVDLARNDLGRVAKNGSVNVTELAGIQTLSHVMHIRSKVQAELAEGKDALDLLRASLPAGTLSGAPKIRAMEIIDELEDSRRGLFGGAVCYMDHRGAMDSCIAIRTAIVRHGIVEVRAGAGIVLDSDPATEAAETRSKAAALLQAIDMAESMFSTPTLTV